jgi:2-polyprenyl-6-methoxyphenol hydroxylase-like FAD-dependent oxidoreductase
MRIAIALTADSRQHNKAFFEMDGQGKCPEIDRLQLRGILLETLEVKWGHKLVNVHAPTKDDAHTTIEFANGTRASADLVVGADGAWSRVRPLLMVEQPEYLGASLIWMLVNDLDARHPELARAMPRGTMFMCDDNKCILAQRNGDGSATIYVTILGPMGIAEALVGAGRRGLPAAGTSAADDAAREQAVLRLKAVFADWAPELWGWLEKADGPMFPRPIVALPVKHAWPHTRGLTLVGDAAHVMSPFAGGQGANLALLDGVELGAALADAAPGEWDTVVRAHEERQQARAAAASGHSPISMDTFLSKARHLSCAVTYIH